MDQLSLQKLINLLIQFEDTFDVDTTDTQYQVQNELKEHEIDVHGDV